MAIRPDDRQLSERIMNDGYNRFVFSAARSCPLYLVGGYLRDVLMGRIGSDRDFVAGGDCESFLPQIVEGTGGKIVRIGDYLRRVVLKDNSTLDFTPMVNDIAEDLAKRDFTINSIAWSPEAGLIDPKGGAHDIVNQMIRMVSKENIENDPIRILRAYRFAGELGMHIDSVTRRAMMDLSANLIGAKGERITLEFFKILNLANPSKILQMMFQDGVLELLFGCAYQELQEKLRAVSKVSKILNALPLKYVDMMDGQFSQNLSYRGVMQLEVLLEGTKSCALVMSSKILRRVEDIETGSRILARAGWSINSLFDAFCVMGDATIAYLLRSGRISLLSEYERYCRITKKGFLPAHEIMSVTNIRGGEKLGRIISLIRRAEFTGQINSREDGLKLLHKAIYNLT